MIEIIGKDIVFISLNKENFLHPLWLRERVKNENLVDKYNKQRLYDPSQLNNNIKIKKASMLNSNLNIEFTDGIQFTYNTDNLLDELNNKEFIEKPILWNSSLKAEAKITYKKDIFASKDMYYSLQNFYKYGFMIFKNVPLKDNYILKFANSIGTVRPTNFGECFNVRSVPKPNDLAYTTRALASHTDNPYRKPVPQIQLLHCIKNEVEGGLSTLVDGFAVANYLRENHQDLFEVVTKTKVRFCFIDATIILENWGELIELSANNEIQQIRHSTRLDYVPALAKKELTKFYKARKLLTKLYSSAKFEIRFKLKAGDLLLMDNYRLLHGRTAYNNNKGTRHIIGCYIDHDSTEGKLRHLKRKFKL